MFVLNFHSGVCTTTTLCFKRYSPCKIWKKPIDNASFFTFFTTLDLIWPKFFPKTKHTFFAGFQWSVLGDSIHINNINWNPVVLKKKKKKKIGKRPKITFLGPTCTKQKTIFFLEITKPDHKLSRKSYSIKI